MPDTPAWWSAVSGPTPAPAAPLAAGAGRPLEPYRGLLTDTATRHGLDPSLLAGVWDFESSGNPGAVNRSSGATGLGQVMPRERGFPDRPTQQQLLDPATNAEWSARILKSGLDRYGSEDKALAAYLGAIDARGNITGAVDANGTGGNQYIRTVRERQQRYADLAAQGPSAQPATPAYVASSAGSLAQGPAWWAAVSAPAAAPTSAQPARVQGSPVTADPAEQAKPGATPQWLQLAQTQLGKPYIWGSAGGRSTFSLTAPGYDCSGFVAQIYQNAFGVSIPAFTGNAYPATRAVDQQAAQPGDLVFWNMNTPDPRRQHVALYIGGGKVIQSGGAGDGVNIAPVTQMPGAEFRRSPAAYAVYGGGGGAPGRQLPATAPEQPQSLTLQGTVAPSWWASVAGR